MTGSPVSCRSSASRFCKSDPPPDKHDASIDDVGRELGRRALEREAHHVDDRDDRFGERLAHLVGVQDDGLRDTTDDVASLHFHLLETSRRRRRSELLLDLLGRLLAEQQIVATLHVLDDRFVHLLAADAEKIREDHAAQADDRDLRAPATDVDDHVSGRFGDR